MYEDRVMKSLFDQSGLKPKGAQAFDVKPTAATPELMTKALGDPQKGPDLSGIAGGVAGAAGGVLQGLSTFQGLNEMDTSSESGGVMSEEDAMLSGAAGGAAAGAAIGSVIPGVGTAIGGAAGAIGGGIIGLSERGKALKEYRNNVQVDNLSQHAEEKAKREKSYYMEKGLADIQNLKALKEKSLGIIS